jgi:hypothetical protein
MAKAPKDKTPPPDQALRDAFKAAEARPVPKTLSDHVERLAGSAVPRKKH